MRYKFHSCSRPFLLAYSHFYPLKTEFFELFKRSNGRLRAQHPRLMHLVQRDLAYLGRAGLYVRAQQHGRVDFYRALTKPMYRRRFKHHAQVVELVKLVEVKRPPRANRPVCAARSGFGGRCGRCLCAGTPHWPLQSHGHKW